MGIDGIGGPRIPGGLPGEGVGGARSVDGPGAIASGEAVQGAQGAEGAGASGGVADVDRARLERGELSVDAYLDLQVERATAHLVDRAPAAALAQVKEELRAQLACDPVLRALAEQVTSGAR